MRQKLEEIKNSAINELKTALSKDDLENIRVRYLGKKGELTQILRGMGALSQEERPVVGKVANEVRSYIEETIKEAFSDIKNKEKSMRLENETIDITMPGKKTSGRKKTSFRSNIRKYERYIYIYGIHH